MIDRRAALLVELRRSGRTLVVPPEQTVLDALDRAGIAAASMCRAGICGTCETVPLTSEPPSARPVRLCLPLPFTRLTLNL